MIAVPVDCDFKYSGNIYVRGLLRGKQGSEYYLMPGGYELQDGRGGLLIQYASENVLQLKKSSLIT